MKLINPNNDILKFIKEQIETSGDFYSLRKNEYKHTLILEDKAKDYSSVISLMITCEEKFDINIDEYKAWDIKTPLDLFYEIQNEMKKKV